MGKGVRSPEFTTWMKAVFKRDNYRCKMPGCKGKSRLGVHRIKEGGDYLPSYGITLCLTCRKAIAGKEAQYEKLFWGIANPESQNVLMELIAMRYGRKK